MMSFMTMMMMMKLTDWPAAEQQHRYGGVWAMWNESRSENDRQSKKTITKQEIECTEKERQSNIQRAREKGDTATENITPWSPSSWSRMLPWTATKIWCLHQIHPQMALVATQTVAARKRYVIEPYSHRIDKQKDGRTDRQVSRQYRET